MKKAIIVLGIIFGVMLIGTGVTGAFLYATIDESKSKSTIIDEKDSQIRNLKNEIAEKDKEIDQQKNKLTKKDKEIKRLNKDLDKKKAQVRKQKEKSKVNDNIADTGRYMSEDSTGIKENHSGDGPGYIGFTREIIITYCSEERISFDLEEWSGAHQTMYGDEICCILKNKKGSFEFTNEGTNGEYDCKGTIEILSNKRVRITSQTNDWWGKGESFIFDKE